MQLDRPLCRALAEARQRSSPREACGLIVRTDDELRIVRCPNRSAKPTEAFAIAPHDWLRIWRVVDRLGGDIVAVWHSHPRGKAELSRRDRAGAWAEFRQVVVGADAIRGYARKRGQWVVDSVAELPALGEPNRPVSPRDRPVTRSDRVRTLRPTDRRLRRPRDCAR